MAKIGTYLVIGIGRFGRGFFKRLLKEGVPTKNIYLVDKAKDNLVAAASDGIDNIFVANVSIITDVDNIIPIDYIDNIVIGTSDLEDSVSIVSSILDGDNYNKKNIYVKSRNHIHSLILKTLGVPKGNIYIPEEEIGSRVALKSLFDSKVDVFDLGADFSLFGIEFTARDLLDLTILEIVHLWSQSFSSKKWNIVLITGINGHQRFPSATDKIQLGERVTFCTTKTERKKIYRFFTKK